MSAEGTGVERKGSAPARLLLPVVALALFVTGC